MAMLADALSTLIAALLLVDALLTPGIGVVKLAPVVRSVVRYVKAAGVEIKPCRPPGRNKSGRERERVDEDPGRLDGVGRGGPDAAAVAV